MHNDIGFCTSKYVRISIIENNEKIFCNWRQSHYTFIFKTSFQKATEGNNLSRITEDKLKTAKSNRRLIKELFTQCLLYAIGISKITITVGS